MLYKMLRIDMSIQCIKNNVQFQNDNAKVEILLFHFIFSTLFTIQLWTNW